MKAELRSFIGQATPCCETGRWEADRSTVRCSACGKRVKSSEKGECAGCGEVRKLDEDEMCRECR